MNNNSVTLKLIIALKGKLQGMKECKQDDK